MAASGPKLSLRVGRAVDGDRFYTWRGHVRHLFPQDCRLVLNAHVGEELAGSAIVSAHEADVDDLPICQLKGSTWFAPGQPVKVLGPGPVTCGHCANATVHQ